MDRDSCRTEDTRAAMDGLNADIARTFGGVASAVRSSRCAAMRSYGAVGIGAQPRPDDLCAHAHSPVRG